MSFDLNVTGKNITFNPKKWEQEIGKHLNGFAFDDSVDWETHSGFLPVSWNDPGDPENRVESGFEFSMETEAAKTSTFKRLFGKGVDSKDIEFFFSFSSSGDAYETGWLAAGSLAKITGASLDDPQEGESYEGDAALKQALKAIQASKSPARNSYNTFDFQAHGAFQKSNEKVIHKLARETFLPYKIMRKGVSKCWHDDLGWCTIIIEFLPSKHHWGMIINVAANFHWDKDDTMSFDFAPDHTNPKYENAKEYEKHNDAMVQQTLGRVLSLRTTLADLQLLKDALIQTVNTYEPHKSYHLGIICGLQGDMAGMSRYFKNVLDTEEDEGVDWIIALKDETRALAALSGDPEKFKTHIIDCMRTSRALKKLPEMEIKLPG